MSRGEKDKSSTRAAARERKTARKDLRGLFEIRKEMDPVAIRSAVISSVQIVCSTIAESAS
jgi:hypothetical protein